MKNVSTLLALCVFAVFALLFPQSGLAQWEPAGDDVLGIYFGETHEVYYELGFAQSDPISVILTNVTGASVGAFEFILTWDGAVLVMTNEGLQQGDLNYGDTNSGEYYVGLASPRSISTGNAVLCEPVFFSFTEDPVYISVTFWDNATIPGAIAYGEFDNVAIVHEMFPASGNFVDPIFAFNDPLFVETESQTWSDLKALYR